MTGGTLNISLSPSLTEFVHERVASGRNASASEVVCEALRWFAACGGEPHQAPTMPELQEQRLDRENARDAVARLRELRQRSQLGPDVTVADLRDEDRR
ncbi:MAG: type II toxin-antitoxin system ParD family antitoxin [Planctomycetota bacterium]